MLGSYQTDINCKFFADLILKKESNILKKYSATTIRGDKNFDGCTGLGVNSLTSRASHYNLLDWKKSKDLIDCIKKAYVTFTKNKDPIYVHCWTNVMRSGEKINEHAHAIYPYTFDHLSGHLGIMVDGTTATYYRINDKVLEEVNREGLITFFSSAYPHWTNQYNGNSTRITIAFDIRTPWQFNRGIIKKAKFLWKKI
tara:strand:- start:42 stop:635 length:594 start_codon:yes stop_codon:yes gene_type:complete